MKYFARDDNDEVITITAECFTCDRPTVQHLYTPEDVDEPWAAWLDCTICRCVRRPIVDDLVPRAK